MSDIKSAAMRVTNIVMGMYAKNLPITPGRVKRGMKTTTVVAVPAISGR